MDPSAHDASDKHSEGTLTVADGPPLQVIPEFEHALERRKRVARRITKEVPESWIVGVRREIPLKARREDERARGIRRMADIQARDHASRSSPEWLAGIVL